MSALAAAIGRCIDQERERQDMTTAHLASLAQMDESELRERLIDGNFDIDDFRVVTVSLDLDLVELIHRAEREQVAT